MSISDRNFFEGKDFGNSPFKALIPKYYPLAYQKYISEETKLLKQKLAWTNNILEAGVGIGRLISEIAPLVKNFVGIDNATLMLNEANSIAKEYTNVKIIHGNIEELNELFPRKYFDYSLCVWNTLGNVDDEIVVLKSLWNVTKGSIFITTYLKGTIEQRENRYQTMGIEITSIDKDNEIFYSKSGLRSKSYSLQDIKQLALAAWLKIVESQTIHNVMLWVELKSLEKN